MMCIKTVNTQGNKFEGYDHSEQEVLAIDRCNQANGLDINKINGILVAYFDKGLTLDDMSDIFSLPKVVLRLIVEAPEEAE